MTVIIGIQWQHELTFKPVPPPIHLKGGT